jgi:hypothetical protein
MRPSIRDRFVVALIITALFSTGCVTNDFKVVDALHRGMAREDANAVINRHGFRLGETWTRPAGGWTDDSHTLLKPHLRAQAVESQYHTEVKRLDHYDVGHGLMGYGWLFLFYDERDVLIDFYRHQIN